MSKKKLPTAAITNELSGASAFFQRPSTPDSTPQEPPSPEPQSVTETPSAPPEESSSSPQDQLARPQANKLASKSDSKLASKQASMLASYQQEVVTTIRRTVKKSGKEVSFIRLTQQEKDQLADIVYTYKRRGVKTSENEINRIAINLLLEDYKQYGEESVLARVIAELLA
jgi:hypothetical protein